MNKSHRDHKRTKEKWNGRLTPESELQGFASTEISMVHFSYRVFRLTSAFLKLKFSSFKAKDDRILSRWDFKRTLSLK